METETMSWSNPLHFRAPLRSVRLAGPHPQPAWEEKLAVAREDSFQQGYNQARAFYEQQMVEAREQFRQLRDEMTQRALDAVIELEKRVTASMPALAVEIARRLFAGFEPPADFLQALCSQALDQLFPEVQNLELFVSPQDLTSLQPLPDAWKAKYPGLRVCADDSLQSGECLVKSRFGTVDARRHTRLSTFVDSLAQS